MITILCYPKYYAFYVESLAKKKKSRYNSYSTSGCILEDWLMYKGETIQEQVLDGTWNKGERTQAFADC